MKAAPPVKVTVTTPLADVVTLPVTICAAESVVSKVKDSTAAAVTVETLSVPPTLCAESMILSPVMTGKLPEIVQVVPPAAIEHVVA